MNPAPTTPTPTPTATLRAEAVGHQFQPTWWCLRDLTLELCTGELLGLVGPNGAGKSTLLRALAGQLRPTAGDVLLDGQPIARMSRIAFARRVAFMPQEPRVSFRFSVEEIVAHGRYPHLGTFGLLSREDLEIVRRAMRTTHVDAFARRPLDELSGGERQRALLASVLAQGTAFLLLDEPTAALDLHHQVDVFARLSALARQGLGIAVITHDLNLAAQYCDRLALIHEGRLTACGTPEEVMLEPILRQAYDTELIVDRNPVTGTPMVVLLGRRAEEPV